MNPASAILADAERTLLIAHYAFYHALDSGARAPTTPAQHHFVAVCRGAAAPETDHERAYTKFKQVVADAGLDEAVVITSGFVLSPEPVGAERNGLGAVVELAFRPCAVCGRPIPPERLAAVPDATRCVSCQQRMESAVSDWHVSETECPRCASRGIKSRMVWRTARDPAKISGYFLACSRFPECRYIDQS
jgi:hypothetical protein